MTKEEFLDLKSSLGSAELVAVSKFKSFDEIMKVYSYGQRVFGENHVQEIEAKFSQKPADMIVHMIGHLQKNKVAKVVPLVDMIQSVDSVELLEKINKAATTCGKTMKVLLEIHSTNEESKTGFETYEQVCECIKKSFEMKNVKICGFMTVGPLCDNEMYTRQCFLKVAGIKQKAEKEFNVLFPVLSMGMSKDYKIALECGANTVRIGTAIFGERNYA